jgi:hypothetical protein
MKTYKIPCTWHMYGTYEIEANSVEEAAQKAEHLPLPEDGEYIEDSFRVDYELINNPVE